MTLPILVFAEGGCSNDSTAFEPFFMKWPRTGSLCSHSAAPVARGVYSTTKWTKPFPGTQSKLIGMESIGMWTVPVLQPRARAVGELLVYTQRHNDAVRF
ncbi:hypothetical protein BDV10DRAFT_172608 [Aspergillus recurvatus]